MIWAASTEVFLTPGPAHQSLQAFERAMEQNDPAIAPSMLYAYAALMESVPFANGAPNLTVDIPVLERLAEERKLPIGGKDFKTGQTMMKTVLAPALDRKSTRLNSSHGYISYAVFCLKKKKNKKTTELMYKEIEK